MNAYATARQMHKILGQIEGWLVKAEEYATSKSFDVNVLAATRLAPDMYPLTRQVQSACDAAKYVAAYASGTPAPSHPDTETTFPELHERIAKARAFVESVDEAAFAGAETRKVSPGWARGGWVTADVYIEQVALPNFYFHAVTAYAILRHSGVPLGKSDFIGDIPFRRE